MDYNGLGLCSCFDKCWCLHARFLRQNGASDVISVALRSQGPGILVQATIGAVFMSAGLLSCPVDPVSSPP